MKAKKNIWETICKYMVPSECQLEDAIMALGLVCLHVYGMVFVFGPWTHHQDTSFEFFFPLVGLDFY